MHDPYPALRVYRRRAFARRVATGLITILAIVLAIMVAAAIIYLIALFARLGLKAILIDVGANLIPLPAETGLIGR